MGGELNRNTRLRQPRHANVSSVGHSMAAVGHHIAQRSHKTAELLKYGAIGDQELDADQPMSATTPRCRSLRARRRPAIGFRARGALQTNEVSVA